MKATLNSDHEKQTPTEEIIASSSKVFDIVDDKGRKLVLKKPTVLAEIEFPLILGAERASNTMFLSRVMPLLYLDTIDGEKISPFNTFTDVEFLIQKLEHEGMDALTLAVVEYFAATTSESKVQERLKKLLGTPN